MAAPVSRMVGKLILVQVEPAGKGRDPACAEWTIVECRERGSIGSAPLQGKNAGKLEVCVDNRLAAHGKADVASSTPGGSLLSAVRVGAGWALRRAGFVAILRLLFSAFIGSGWTDISLIGCPFSFSYCHDKCIDDGGDTASLGGHSYLGDIFTGYLANLFNADRNGFKHFYQLLLINTEAQVLLAVPEASSSFYVVGGIYYQAYAWEQHAERNVLYGSVGDRPYEVRQEFAYLDNFCRKIFQDVPQSALDFVKDLLKVSRTNLCQGAFNRNY
ncbi:hypothetical protein D3C84_563590 [compost metagenome]